MKTIVRILTTAAAVMMLANFANAQTDQHLCIGTVQKSYRANGGGTTAGGSSYNWTLPTGATEVSRIDNDITIDWSAVAAGVHTITVEEVIGGCIGAQYSFEVEVHAAPTATITFPVGGNVCNGVAFDLQVDFTGTGDWTFTYEIEGVAQAPITTSDDPYTLNVAGIAVNSNFEVTLVSDTYCTDIASGSNVTVNVQTFGTTGIIAL